MTSFFADDTFSSRCDTDSPSSYFDESLATTPRSLDFSSVPPSPDSVSLPSSLLPMPAIISGLEVLETTQRGLVSECDFHFAVVGLASEGMSVTQAIESLAGDFKFYGGIERIYRVTDCAQEDGVFGVKMDCLEAAWKVVRSPPLFSAAKYVEILRYRMPPLADESLSAPSLTVYLLSAPRHILPATLRRQLEDCKLPAPVSMIRVEEEGMILWKLTYKSQVEVDFMLRRQISVDRKPTVLLPSPKTQTELIERIAELEVKITWTTPIRDIDLFESLRDRFGTVVELQPYWKQGFAIAIFQHKSVAAKVIEKGSVETPSSMLSFASVEQYYRLFGYLILRPNAQRGRRLSCASNGPWRGPRKVPRRF